ncbi:MAG: Fic family protein [Acidobacteriota bacterium]|nr:Fic family protein [Acidobacteriota bacterium]
MYSAPEHRAGTRRLQPGGYRAFLPKPLPPEPALRLDVPLQALLSEADQALGRLDGSIAVLPDPDLFLLTYIKHEAVLSSRIEGTESSLEDVLAAEARVLAPERPDDAGEVLNYAAAMREGIAAVQEEPISVALICRLHRRLLENTRGAALDPGRLRDNQVWIGAPGSDIAQAVFVPPPPADVAGLLGELEAFLRAESQLAPPLVRIGLAHAQFETIHPFRDGNGRIGRLLITLLLCRDRILTKPVLYLSWFFMRHRAEYYDRLQRVRDRGDWEGWIAFFLRAVAVVSADAAATTRRILTLRERHRALITERLGRSAGSGHRVLEGLFRQPFVTVAGVRRQVGTSFAAANALVSRMVGAGILEEVTGWRRNRVFAYRAYLRLFSEGPGGPAPRLAPD